MKINDIKSSTPRVLNWEDRIRIQGTKLVVTDGSITFCSAIEVHSLFQRVEQSLITHLDLSHVTLEPTAWEEFTKVLPDHHAITHLTLHNMGVLRVMNLIALPPEFLKGLKGVAIRRNGDSEPEFNQIINLFLKSVALEFIDLSHCRLSEFDILAIFSGVRPTLKKILIDENLVTKNGYENLSHQLKSCIKQPDWVNVIRNQKYSDYLDLREVSLSSEDWKKLCDYLPRIDSVTNLLLGRSKIDVEEIKELISRSSIFLKRIKSLRVYKFNMGSSRGKFNQIVELIKKCSLRSLMLYDCELSDDDVERLLPLLAQKRVIHLSLLANETTKKTMDLLLQPVEPPRKRRRLNSGDAVSTFEMLALQASKCEELDFAELSLVPKGLNRFVLSGYKFLKGELTKLIERLDEADIKKRDEPLVLTLNYWEGDADLLSLIRYKFLLEDKRNIVLDLSLPLKRDIIEPVLKELEKELKGISYEALDILPDEIRDIFFEELLKKQFVIKDVGAGGNCLFASVAHFTDYNHLDLRKMAVEFMSQNKDDFAPFFSFEEPFNKYLENMAKPGYWGGNHELVALSALINRSIHVFESTAMTKIEEGKLLTGLVFGEDILNQPPIHLFRVNKGHYKVLEVK